MDAYYDIQRSLIKRPVRYSEPMYKLSNLLDIRRDTRRNAAVADDQNNNDTEVIEDEESESLRHIP